MYKDKEVNKNVNFFFINVWRKSIFDIYFTEFGTALTTILPILFHNKKYLQYRYYQYYNIHNTGNTTVKYCYSDSRNLWAAMKAAGLAL